MTTFTTGVELTTINCCCGGTYAIQETFRKEKEMVGGSWTCPYCKTGWGYANNGENARLKKQIAEAEREKQRLADAAKYQRERKEEALAEAEHFRKSRDGMKGAITKIKKRIGRGVCPCCNRHFSNVERHMKCMHPEVATGETPES